MNNNPTRVIIKAHLRDIPAETKQRVHRLGSDFCKQMLGRPINIQVQQGGYDAMHFLPGFDSAIRNDENISRYFIYDFNVTGRLDKEELLGIEHKFYLATRIGDSWWAKKEKENNGLGFVLISIGYLLQEKDGLIPQGATLLVMFGEEWASKRF